MKNIELNQLALQLMRPHGKEGKILGKIMNKSNKNMINDSIIALQLEKRNKILEIGLGNCKHLKEIMKKAKGVKYFGFEVSETITQEAIQINQKYIKKRKALFQNYDGQKMPRILAPR